MTHVAALSGAFLGGACESQQHRFAGSICTRRCNDAGEVPATSTLYLFLITSLQFLARDSRFGKGDGGQTTDLHHHQSSRRRRGRAARREDPIAYSQQTDITRWVASGMQLPLLLRLLPPFSLDTVWQQAQHDMARFSWTQALLAVSPLVYGQQDTTSNLADGLTTTAYSSGSSTNSIATATVSGATSTYSIPFTVPASADIGPNILPNIKDPNAKQAQALCPGYHASNVNHTEYGFTAALNLAGDAVS